MFSVNKSRAEYLFMSSWLLTEQESERDGVAFKLKFTTIYLKPDCVNRNTNAVCAMW